MATLYNNAIVEKRNVLNELRSNNMTVQELRFFSIYLSKIDPYNKDTRCVRFPIEDFQRIMGFGKLNIGQLRASTDSLLCKIVHVPDEDGRGFRAFQLFKECHIFKGKDEKWYVEIDAHDKVVYNTQESVLPKTDVLIITSVQIDVADIDRIKTISRAEIVFNYAECLSDRLSLK